MDLILNPKKVECMYRIDKILNGGRNILVVFIFWVKGASESSMCAAWVPDLSHHALPLEKLVSSRAFPMAANG